MPIKNFNYEADITDISSQGYGIARIDNLVCFVAGGITGDRVNLKIIKVNKDYCVGKIENISTPSPYRKTPECEIFRQCGGCSFAHIERDYEKALKKSFVEAEMKKQKLDITVNDVICTEETTRYRNKAQYPVDFFNNIGFFSPRTHKICPCKDCLLQPKIFSEITNEISDFMKTNGIKGYDEENGKGTIRHIYLRQGKSTGEISVCLIINGDNLPCSDEFVLRMKCFPEVKSVLININKKKTNVITGEKYNVLYGRDYIEDVLCGLRFRISPASFYQVNHDCTELLYGEVIKLVKSGECKNVTDLYCGTGTIGLCVAKNIPDCRLYGVEIVPEAIENAKVNAQTNGIANAEFVCADSKNAENGILEKSDVVILDPPRKGVTKELIEKIAKSNVKRVVYVSCSPGTLARDIKEFQCNGYSCSTATPFDMFPGTGHVETVVLMSRNKG